MRSPLNSFISPSYFLSSSLSSRGDPERELHSEPWLVGPRLSDLRDDTGPVALPQAQGARQKGGGGQTSARGPGGVLGQVLGGGEGHLQTGEREDSTGHIWAISYKWDKETGDCYVKIKHVTFSRFGFFYLDGRLHNYWSMKNFPSLVLYSDSCFVKLPISLLNHLLFFISWLLKFSLLLYKLVIRRYLLSK